MSEEVAAAPQDQEMSASEWLAMMDSPAHIERHMEAILKLSSQFGVDRSRDLLEQLDDRRRAVIAAFGDDVLSPGVQYLIGCAIEAWWATHFDWGALTEEYANSVGKSVAEVVDFATKRNQASNSPEPQPELAGEDDTEEREGDFGLPSWMEEMIIRPPSIEMSQDLQIRHDDAATDTSVLFERFSRPNVNS